LHEERQCLVAWRETAFRRGVEFNTVVRIIRSHKLPAGPLPPQRRTSAAGGSAPEARRPRKLIRARGVSKLKSELRESVPSLCAEVAGG